MAVRQNTAKESPADHAHPAEFTVCDVAQADQVQALINKARQQAATMNQMDHNSDSDLLTLYNRFFLHTLDEEQERRFLTALAQAIKTGDKLYMEFRCSLDSKQEKVYKGHYRRYVDTEKLIDFLPGAIANETSVGIDCHRDATCHWK
jgi:hypothetical protein